MEPDNPLLDDYTLRLTGKRRPRVCFVPTASGDSQSYIENFRSAFGPPRAAASLLLLFNRGRRSPRLILEHADVIYVGGGSTANMLAVWRLHGVDVLLRRAWRSGVVLTGISAGMNAWFEACSTDSFGPLAPLRDGLGLLPGASCPHFDSEPTRRPTLNRFVRQRRLPSAWAADDGAALHFVGRRQHACVASRPSARGYSVECRQGRVVETELTTTYLGAPGA